MTSERAEPCTVVSTSALYTNVTSSVFDVIDNETVTAIGRVWSMPAQPVYVNAVIGIISVLGVLSNSAVLAILLQKKHRKLAANLYLVNLAVGMYVWSCVVLCCVVLCCVVLCCVVLCCVVLCCVVLSCLVLSCLVLFCLVLSCIVKSSGQHF